jgi:hypothetical protein
MTNHWSFQQRSLFQEFIPTNLQQQSHIHIWYKEYISTYSNNIFQWYLFHFISVILNMFLFNNEWSLSCAKVPLLGRLLALLPCNGCRRSNVGQRGRETRTMWWIYQEWSYESHMTPLGNSPELWQFTIFSQVEKLNRISQLYNPQCHRVMGFCAVVAWIELEKWKLFSHDSLGV